MPKSKRDRINSALYKLKRSDKKFQYIHMSNLISGGLRVSIELGEDEAIEITRKSRGGITSELVKRHYDSSGSIGGFGVRIENVEKTKRKPIAHDYNDKQSRIIDIIKSVK